MFLSIDSPKETAREGCTLYVKSVCDPYLSLMQGSSQLPKALQWAVSWVEFGPLFVCITGTGSLLFLSVCLAGWCRHTVCLLLSCNWRARFVARKTNGAFKHLIVSGNTLPPELLEAKKTLKMAYGNRWGLSTLERNAGLALLNTDYLLTHLFI